LGGGARYARKTRKAAKAGDQEVKLNTREEKVGGRRIPRKKLRIPRNRKRRVGDEGGTPR